MYQKMLTTFQGPEANEGGRALKLFSARRNRGVRGHRCHWLWMGSMALWQEGYDQRSDARRRVSRPSASDLEHKKDARQGVGFGSVGLYLDNMLASLVTHHI